VLGTRLASISRMAIAALLAASLGAGAARANDEKAQPLDSDAGMGIAAGLASLVYTPAKVLYAIGGGVAAGLAYLASAGNQDVTEPILTPSVRGDYVVTPEHLRGQRPLEFFGREPAAHTTHARVEPPAVSSGDGLDHAAGPGEASEGEPAVE